HPDPKGTQEATKAGPYSHVSPKPPTVMPAPPNSTMDARWLSYANPADERGSGPPWPALQVVPSHSLTSLRTQLPSLPLEPPPPKTTTRWRQESYAIENPARDMGFVTPVLCTQWVPYSQV